MPPHPPNNPKLKRSYNSSRGCVRSWRAATKVSRLLKGGYPIKPMLHKGNNAHSTQFWGTSRERRARALRTCSSGQSRSSAHSWACQWNWPVHTACSRRPSPITTSLPLPPDQPCCCWSWRSLRLVARSSGPGLNWLKRLTALTRTSPRCSSSSARRCSPSSWRCARLASGRGGRAACSSWMAA